MMNRLENFIEKRFTKKEPISESSDTDSPKLVKINKKYPSVKLEKVKKIETGEKSQSSDSSLIAFMAEMRNRMNRQEKE